MSEVAETAPTKWLAMSPEQRKIAGEEHLRALTEYERHFRKAERERNQEQQKEVRR